MIVNGKIEKQVEINPLEVLENLYKAGKYNNKERFEENGKYYQKFIIEDVNNNKPMLKEISKKDYDYYKALETVINYLK